MLEIITSIFTSIIDKFIGNVLKSNEDRSYIAKELYIIYVLVAQAIEALESAHKYLHRHITEGISGPSGDPIIDCGKKLCEIANEYFKHVRWEWHSSSKSMVRRRARKRQLDVKAIALFDNELADALIATRSVYLNLSAIDQMLTLPCFSGDSRGIVVKTDIDRDSLFQYIKSESPLIINFDEFSSLTQYDLRKDGKKRLNNLLKLFEVTIDTLSASKARLGRFIRDHYKIEDLV